MKLLHNESSELSRHLKASAPEGVVVLQAGEHDYLISAYPSVVIHREAAEYQMPFYGSEGELLGVKWTAHDEYEEIIRMPISWEAVDEYVAFRTR